MYASEFNNNDNNPIQRKRENMKNRTLKRRESIKSNPKIEAMVRKIHEDENDDDLSEFQPLGPPSSAGMERLDAEGMEAGLEQRLNEQQNPPISYESQQSNQNIQETFPCHACA